MASSCYKQENTWDNLESNLLEAIIFLDRNPRSSGHLRLIRPLGELWATAIVFFPRAISRIVTIAGSLWCDSSHHRRVHERVLGTEVELLTMATLLKTKIITVAKSGACHSWLKLREAAGDEHSSEEIYLLNENEHL